LKILVVVDMQKDFIDGALGTAEAAAILPNVITRIENSPPDELILLTKDTHGEDYLNTPEGKKLPVSHCVKGTEGWDVNPDVLEAWRKNKSTAAKDENIFEKPVFGSVALVEFITNLHKISPITGIELLGLCTDVCVVSNAIMLKNTLPDVPVAVIENCCAGVTPQSHTEAINTMKMCQVDIV